MIGYYVTQRQQDTVVIPEAGVAQRVDRAVLRRFLADDPEFGTWEGEALGGRKPEDFGTVLATREEEAPPTILDQAHWNERVMAQLKVR
ncbi:MAG TPA: hypothetical protein V6D05_05080 [Stenomitos sp.]